MNDLMYIIKICMGAVNILLTCEIILYLFANRRDKLKRIRKSKNQTTLTLRISLGFVLFFFFSLFGFIFYILEVRMIYFYSETPIEEALHVLNSLKNFCFVYAFASLSFFLSSLLTRTRLQIPLIIGIILWSFLSILLDWTVNLSAYIVTILSILPIMALIYFVWITKEQLRKLFLIIFIGFVFFLGGWATMTQSFVSLLQFIDYSGPEALILVSLILIGYGFVSIPSFNEAFTTLFVEELYLTTNDGREIFRYRFKTPLTELPEDNQSKSDEEFFCILDCRDRRTAA